MLNALKIEAIKKREKFETLKNDVQRLKQNIDARNNVTQPAIDGLKEEIRILTNRKAELELKIRISLFLLKKLKKVIICQLFFFVFFLKNLDGNVRNVPFQILNRI
jgi:hypothetical protein